MSKSADKQINNLVSKMSKLKADDDNRDSSEEDTTDEEHTTDEEVADEKVATKQVCSPTRPIKGNTLCYLGYSGGAFYLVSSRCHSHFEGSQR